MYKFRLDNRGYTADKSRHCINPSLSSLKGFGKNIAEELYSIKDCKCTTFTDLLLYIKSNTSIGKSIIESLIKIDYFSEFGNSNKLSHILKTFDKAYDNTKKCFKKQISKSRVVDYGITDELVAKFSHKETDKTYLMVDMLGMLREFETVEFKPFPTIQQASYQQAILKRVSIIDRTKKSVCVVGEVDTKYAPKINGYSLKNGGYYDFKIPQKIFDRKPLVEGDVIIIDEYDFKNKTRKDDSGKMVSVSDEKTLWVTSYRIIFESELRKKIS